MGSHFVVGVDPGGSTGIFITRDGARYAVYQGDPSEGLSSLATFLRQRRDAADVVILACERYYEGSRTGARSQQSITHEVIGVVKILAESYGCEFHLQSPGDAKKIAPNTLLRDVGFYVTAREVERPDAHDVNDAARHALLLLATHYPVTFERLLGSRGGEPAR